MLIAAVGLLLLGFLVYGALLLGRLRREDATGWPEFQLGRPGARLRLHPSWHVRMHEDGLVVRPGVEGGTLTVRWVSTGDLPLGERLSGLATAGGTVLDKVEIERFESGGESGVRVSSAGTLPDGERRWIECYLIRGPGACLFLSYRCPVLSGSVDSLTMSRTAETVLFD